MIAVLVSIVLPCFLCYAQKDITVLQTYAWEQYMDIFMTEGLNLDQLNVKVSNQTAEVVDSALIGENNVIVKTTLLIDNSASIPTNAREKVLTYINSFIEHLSAKEQAQIVAFDEELTVLQEFTSDHSALSSVVDSFQFDGQYSILYNAIYDTISKVQLIEDESCYYRTIIITDGLDDTLSGVTKEELYLKLQEDRYPIDIIAVSKEKQNEPEKELSALARISGGRYVNLYPETDVLEVQAALEVNNIAWVRIQINGALLDGSTRRVDIGDEIRSVTFDGKVSVFDLPATDTPEPTKEPVVTPESVVTKEPVRVTEEPVVQPTSDPTPIEQSQENKIGIILGIVGFVLLLAVGVVVVIGVMRNKKKNTSTGEIPPRTDETPKKPQFIIKLSNVKSPGITWTVPVQGQVLIGRSENADVYLSDQTVSREQCKIVVQNDSLVLIHLSKTNKTFVNGVNVEQSYKLHSGALVKFGHELLHVDSISKMWL